MTTDSARRVREFLHAYPNDGSSNVDPEHIYTYGADGDLHTLTWSDLDAIVQLAERVATLPTAADLEALVPYRTDSTNTIAWLAGWRDCKDLILSHGDVQSQDG